MNKQTEALKLALEALDMMVVPRGFQAQVRIKEVYDTIKEILAQPEQPKVRTGDCLLTGFCASEGHKIQKAEPEQMCRDDGRCQYAIDVGAEGMGHCLKGKCVMSAQPEQKPVSWKLVPVQPTEEMLKAMDECSTEGYDERLYAGHAASVYMAAVDVAPIPLQPKEPEQEPVVTDAMVEAAVKAFWGYENSKVCRTAYRLAIKAALQEKFCDNNCVWTDHHPDCKLAQPDRQELQAKGEHPAPCARFCEANAFQIEIRNLKDKLENQHPEWYHTKNTHGCDVFYHKTEERSYMFGEITPLYTTPPQRKPLTNEYLKRVIYEHTKLNPNLRDDQELIGYIINAIDVVISEIPQRKPLNDEMRKQMKKSFDSDNMEMRGAFIDGWTSTEAAHGIKE